MCLREERWTGDDVEVRVRGGQRRPPVHPELAAWETLRDALRDGDRRVVGRCSGCDQPLVAEGSGPSVDWTIALPEGSIAFRDGTLSGPAGTLTVDAADALVQDAWRERIQPAQAAFKGTLLGVMAVPMLVWAVACFIVFWFLFNIGRGGLGLVP